MSNPCRDTRKLFDSLFDGDISRSDRKMVFRHLKGCASCRAEYLKERDLVRIFETLPRLSCPDRVTRSILADTVKRDEPRKRVARSRSNVMAGHWRIVFAGAAAAALILLFVFRPEMSQEPAAQVELSQTDANRAKAEATWSLAYLAKTMNRTEKKVVQDVLFKELPSTVKKSLQNAVPIFRGGQQ